MVFATANPAPKSFPPTEEQQKILAALAETDRNILINALAGAAKTSTLVLLAKQLQGQNVLALSFNAAIKKEMERRFPANVQSKTLNGLGHSILSRYMRTQGLHLRLDNRKNGDLLSAEINAAGLSPNEREEISDNFSKMLQAVQYMKASGFMTEKIAARYGMESNALVSDIAEIRDRLYPEDEEVSDPELRLIGRTFVRSLDKAMKEGIIDFADQLLLPTILEEFVSYYPRHDYILIDEAQDLSPLNMQMLGELQNKKRIIAVGDRYQAIYAFRGAHANGMSAMKEMFDMVEFPLTITFRCPKTIVRHVQWHTPAMRWFDDNPMQGEVLTHDTWELSDIPDNATVICRNNAPLFRLAIGLLKSGRYPELHGNDMTRWLIGDMKKVAKLCGVKSKPKAKYPPAVAQAEALAGLEQYQSQLLAKAKNSAGVLDRMECLRIFITEKPDLEQAARYLEKIMESRGRIYLSTGHKAMGLEFDCVFILDQHLIHFNRELSGSEDQERNLLYVMQTRTKNELHYIKTSDCLDFATEEE